MSLILNISSPCIKKACTVISFSELTGVYNASLNVGGWSTPNPGTHDVTLATIVITRPDGILITITNPDGLPTSDTSLEYEIPVATINSTWTKIQDGLYTIVYSVTIASIVYSVTKYVLFTCNIECCVAKLYAKTANDNNCTCDSIIMKNAQYADGLLQGLLAAKSCGNIVAINNLLTKLNKICTSANSNCGCS